MQLLKLNALLVLVNDCLLQPFFKMTQGDFTEIFQTFI